MILQRLVWLAFELTTNGWVELISYNIFFNYFKKIENLAFWIRNGGKLTFVGHILYYQFSVHTILLDFFVVSVFLYTFIRKINSKFDIYNKLNLFYDKTWVNLRNSYCRFHSITDHPVYTGEGVWGMKTWGTLFWGITLSNWKWYTGPVVIPFWETV